MYTGASTTPLIWKVSFVLTILQTLICAAVIDYLIKTFKKQDIPIICMYLNYKERGSQSLENLIASLLKQLIQQKGPSFRSPEANRLYQGTEEEGRPTLNEFFSALCAEIQCYDRCVKVRSCRLMTDSLLRLQSCNRCRCFRRGISESRT